MKINKDNTIQISGKTTAVNLPNTIEKGSKIIARVIRRLDSNHAVLEISGKKVSAEFRNSVPVLDDFLLTLESKKNNTYTFRFINGIPIKSSASEIFKFTIFDLSNINIADLQNLNNYIENGITSLLFLNKLCLGISNDNNYTKNKITRLLNKLLKMGISKKNLILLSIILLNGKEAGFDYIFSIISILGSDQNELLMELKKSLKNKKEVQKKIEILLNEIDKIMIKNPQKKDEIIKELIDIIMGTEKFKNYTINTGEIPYFTSNEFKSLEFVSNKNALLFSINLSDLGNLEILIKNNKSDFFLTIFCEKNSAKKALKKTSDTLYYGLKKIINKNVHLVFYTKKEAIEKIIEIYPSVIFNRFIDIKA